MRLLALLIALLGFVLGSAAAQAQTFPKFTGLVVDAANVLPPETEAALTAKLQALQQDTKRQLVVATIPDLQGYPIEEYGYRLGRSWGVGLRDVNNGAILFIAPNEGTGRRGPRLEVGYGLEPILTDAFASVVIRQEMLPRLRANGDIAGAMTAGTDAVIAQLRAAPEEAQAKLDAAVKTFDQSRSRPRTGGSDLPFTLIFWGLVIAFVALAAMRSGKRGRRYRGGSAPVILWGPGFGDWGGSGGSGISGWSGGSSGGDSFGGWGGGGFSGGGGGSFGGGGASGDW